MNLPIVYQSSIASGDGAMRYMLFVADVWIRTKPKKISIADMDEYWNLPRARDDFARAIEETLEATDERIRSRGGVVPARPWRYRRSDPQSGK